MFTPEAIAGYVGTGIWTLINLFVIYWFLHHFLFRAFSDVIQKRQKLIEEQLDEASTQREIARKREEESRQKLADSVKQASDLVREARQKALNQEAQILKEASEEAQAILHRNAEECKRMRNNMYSDMRQEIADLSVAIASKVVGAALTQEEQNRLVDRYLEEEIAMRNREEGK